MAEQPSRLFLLALVAVTATGPLAMQIFLPALPFIQQDFGVAPGTAQLVLSLSMLSIALSTLAYGPISDRYGRRPVLLGGLLIFIVGSLVCALADSLWLLIAGRVVQAIGGASGMVLARAIVRDVYAHEKVASVIAYLTIAMVVAPMVAPAIGGFLTDWFGWRSIFAFVAIFGLPVLVLVLFRLAETHSQPARHYGLAGMLQGFGLLLRSPLFCGYAFSGAFTLSAFFAFAAAAPYVMVVLLERPVTEYGLYFIVISLSFMAGNFATARLSPRVGQDRMILIGILLAMAAMLIAGLLALLHVWGPIAIYLPMVFVALGNGLSMPNMMAGALGVHPQSAGTASGLSGFLQMALAALFAQAAGSWQGDTPAAMIAFMVAASTLSLVSFLLGLRLGRQTQAAGAG